MVSGGTFLEHRVLTVLPISEQMEQYFAMVSETMEGYGDFEAEALAFKVRFFRLLAKKDPRAYKAFHSARTTEP